MTSLKAVKTATTNPSNAEVVLLDSDKITIAPSLELASDYVGQGIKLQDTLTKFAKMFCGLMSDTEATSQKALAYKKHIYETVSNARGVEISSVTRPLNLAIKEQVKAQVALGGYKHLGWMESAKPSAVSMTKARAENDVAMSKLSTEKLASQLVALVDMPEKVQAPIRQELAKRNKAIAKNHSDELKQNLKDLKDSITKLIVTETQVACMAWAINNLQVIEKLYKQAS
jgi:CRISPR/Cas system-associated protein endoribonuclease Cas2